MNLTMPSSSTSGLPNAPGHQRLGGERLGASRTMARQVTASTFTVSSPPDRRLYVVPSPRESGAALPLVAGCATGPLSPKRCPDRGTDFGPHLLPSNRHAYRLGPDLQNAPSPLLRHVALIHRRCGRVILRIAAQYAFCVVRPEVSPHRQESPKHHSFRVCSVRYDILIIGISGESMPTSGARGRTSHATFLPVCSTGQTRHHKTVTDTVERGRQRFRDGPEQVRKPEHIY